MGRTISNGGLLNWCAFEDNRQYVRFGIIWKGVMDGSYRHHGIMSEGSSEHLQQFSKFGVHFGGYGKFKMSVLERALHKVQSRFLHSGK